jgi:hypothetical protein
MQSRSGEHTDGVGIRDVGRVGAGRGWRRRVADAVAPAVAQRTPWSDDNVRAALGLVFVAISLRFVAGALRAGFRRPAP